MIEVNNGLLTIANVDFHILFKYLRIPVFFCIIVPNFFEIWQECVRHYYDTFRRLCIYFYRLPFCRQQGILMKVIFIYHDTITEWLFLIKTRPSQLTGIKDN